MDVGLGEVPGTGDFVHVCDSACEGRGDRLDVRNIVWDLVMSGSPS